MVVTTRFLLLALVAIAAELIPAVHGAALPGKKFRDAYDGDVDMIGHGVLGDMENGRMWKIKLFLVKDGEDVGTEMQGVRRGAGPPPTAPDERRPSNWRAKNDATLDDVGQPCSEDVALKRQLRATIRIRGALAGIETLVFGNRSPWDCRHRKNPLKEIVIDIVTAENERSIARDKKRSRDGHRELAVRECAAGYRGDAHPGSHEAPGCDSAEDTKASRSRGRSSAESLMFEHRAEDESDEVSSVSSDANCDCATNAETSTEDVDGAKANDGPGLADKSAKARATEEASRRPERSDYYVESDVVSPLEFPEATEEEEPSRGLAETNANTNLNVDTFSRELNGDYANRESDERAVEQRERQETPENDREMGSESSASEDTEEERVEEEEEEEEEEFAEDSAEDDFGSKQRNMNTDKNWNTNSNLNANAIDGNGEHGDTDDVKETFDLSAKTSYISRNERDKKYDQRTGKLCEDRRGSVTEETDINSRTNARSSSKNPFPIDERYEGTSTGDFATDGRADADEVDSRDAAGERSTENEKRDDNRVNRRVDAAIADENDDGRDSKSCVYCAPSSSSSADRDNVERNAKNYNGNEAKLDLARTAKKGDNVSRSGRKVKSAYRKNNSEMGDDNDLDETVDELLDDTRLSAAVAKASMEIENPSGTHRSKIDRNLNVNSNVNVNSYRLIRPGHRGKKRRSAPARSNEARRGADSSDPMRNESRVDRETRQPSSMNNAIDAVDEVLPDDISRIAAAREISREIQGTSVGTNNGTEKRALSK